MSEKVLGFRKKDAEAYDFTNRCKNGIKGFCIEEEDLVPVYLKSESVLLSWLDSELAMWIKFTKKNKFASPETVASVEILCFKLYADACKKAETENNSRLVKRTGFYKPKLVKKEGRK